MILLIDNYDSFTFNLYQMAALCGEVKVVKNDEITASEVKELKPDSIIISPGPGRPSDAGQIESIISDCREIPILGICLGHQAIGEVFGAKVTYAKQLMHGKKTTIYIANGNRIFKGLPPVITGARYNSLSVDVTGLPDELLVIGEDESGEIMAIKHRDYEIYGLQFHPESILTEKGDIIIKNFLLGLYNGEDRK